MPTLSAPQRTFPPFTPTAEQQQGPAFAKKHKPALKHALTAEQLDAFWANGYIALPGLFSPDEAAAFQDEADRLYHDSSRVHPDNQRYEFAKNENTPDAEPIAWKIDPFHDVSELFKQMVYDRRILDALASIYDGREPRLFKDKLIYKPPHTHGNGLHQDYNWWQGYPTSLISVAVSIDPATEDNGCTKVYPGYEKGLITEPGAFNWLDPEKVDRESGLTNIAQPGDVVMFHCFAPHEAGPNKTDAFRRQAFLTYNDSADGEHYQEHSEHYRWYQSKDWPAERRERLYFR